MRTTSAVDNDDGDDGDDGNNAVYYKCMHLLALNSWCSLGNGGFKHSQFWVPLFLIILRYYPFES